MTTASALNTQLSYELRNDSGEFPAAELLAYQNRVCEMLHTVLVRRQSEIVCTGTGDFTTVAGTQYYDLTDSGIADVSDLWVPYKVWVDEYPPMDKCSLEDLFDSINEEEKDNTGHRTRPLSYCMKGDVMWFKEVPDDAYTVRFWYFPSYSAIATVDAAVPHSGMFDQAIIESVLLIARNRDEQNYELEAQLMNILEDAAHNMLGLRGSIEKQFTVKMNIRRRV
jgi:hypothetical protein